ncbi:hypothetical protein AYI68_g4341, partial [Smittium mucronatum]
MDFLNNRIYDNESTEVGFEDMSKTKKSQIVKKLDQVA